MILKNNKQTKANKKKFKKLKFSSMAENNIFDFLYILMEL